MLRQLQSESSINNSPDHSQVPNIPPLGPSIFQTIWPTILLVLLIFFLLVFLFVLDPMLGILGVFSLIPAVVIIGIYQYISDARRQSVSIHWCTRMALCGMMGTVIYLVGSFIHVFVLNLHTKFYLGIIPVFICGGASVFFSREASNFEDNGKLYLIGLGSWTMSGGSGRFIRCACMGCLFPAFCLLLGFVATYFIIASFEIVGSNWITPHDASDDFSAGRDVGGTFVMAFFAAACCEETFKYGLVCIARSLSIIGSPHFENSVLIMTLWGVLGFATIENLMYVILSGTSLGVQVAIMRGISAVPMHCFTSLITAIGVLQVYVVINQSKKKALCIMILHLLLAIGLHGTYGWTAMMLSRPSLAGDQKKKWILICFFAVCYSGNPLSYLFVQRTLKKRIAKSLTLEVSHVADGTMYRCSNCQLLQEAPLGASQFQCSQCKFFLVVLTGTGQAQELKESPLFGIVANP